MKIRPVTIIVLLVLASRVSSDTVPIPGLPAAVSDSDFYFDGEPPATQVRLGQLLFFDRILSGNRNIACATCHHPELGTSDGVSLSLGEGAIGLGPARRTIAAAPVTSRVPRNAPALFLLGAKEFRRLFHDGRVETDENHEEFNGFWTPARNRLPAGLENVLAAQAMFPVLSAVEMAGQTGENDIADATSARDFDGAWERLARRIREIPEYVNLFVSAYPHIRSGSDIRFTDVANAIAAFETFAFRADNSPFDRYLRSGDPRHLSAAAYRGMVLFYGDAGCSQCHSGKFQTDHEFHAIGMPQIGPGKGDGVDQSFWNSTGSYRRMEDFGRGRVSFRKQDYYHFRTPSLRNTALTGPWGHSGAYYRLEDVILHHISPKSRLEAYRNSMIKLPPMNHMADLVMDGSGVRLDQLGPRKLRVKLLQDSWVVNNSDLKKRIALANELDGTELSKDEVSDLMAFLHALTDPASGNARQWIPDRVPSGLRVKEIRLTSIQENLNEIDIHP